MVPWQEALDTREAGVADRAVLAGRWAKGASQSITGCAARPLTCTSNPPAPVMSTSPVSQRSTDRCTAVSGQVAHLAFPRRGSCAVPRLQNVYGRGARSQIEPPGFFRNKGLVS
jgi:hypothetical protein